MLASRRAGLRTLAGVTIALAILACAGSPAREAQAPASAAPATEHGESDEQAFAFPDGSLRATVRARGVRIEPDATRPGESVARFELGGAAPASCSFSGHDDARAAPAHLMTAVAVGAMQSFSPDAVPQLGSRVRAGVIGEAPFVALDLAMTEGDRGAVLQQRFARKHDRAVHCVWAAADAEPSFDRFFAGLVKTLETEPRPAPPLYGSVLSVHVDGEPAGVVVVSLFEEAPGVLRMERRSSLLVASPDGSRLPIDAVEIERTRADASLLSARTRRMEGFASPIDLALEPAGRGGWRVHGQLGDSAVDERFEASGPGSYLRYLRTLRSAALARRTGVPIRERHWAPDLSVGGLSDAVTTLEVSESGSLRASERVGSSVFSFAIDEAGLPDSGWVQRGPVRIEQRREAQFGELPGR